MWHVPYSDNKVDPVVVEALFPKQSGHSNDIQVQCKFPILPFKQATSSGYMSITKLAKLSWRSQANETTCKSTSKTHER